MYGYSAIDMIYLESIFVYKFTRDLRPTFKKVLLKNSRKLVGLC